MSTLDKYKQRLHELAKNTTPRKEDMLLMALKIVGAALLVFTFFSGLIFTVIPLMRNMWNHIELNIVQPINSWMLAEPTTGHSMVFLVNLTVFIIILFFARVKLFHLGFWLLTKLEQTWYFLKRKFEESNTSEVRIEPANDNEPLF